MTIVEFADYCCPSCVRVFEALSRLETEHPDLEIEFKNLPLTHIHPDAMVAAEAAECARLQGRFKDMQTLLFSNHEKLDGARVVELAHQAGLDIERFKKDMTTGACLEKIQSDLDEARSREIRGTPCVYIDGERMKEDATYESLSRVLHPRTKPVREAAATQTHA